MWYLLNRAGGTRVTDQSMAQWPFVTIPFEIKFALKSTHAAPLIHRSVSRQNLRLAFVRGKDPAARPFLRPLRPMAAIPGPFISLDGSGNMFMGLQHSRSWASYSTYRAVCFPWHNVPVSTNREYQD